MQNEFVFTSESVSEGHPDKIADQISDGILDAHIALDPDCRVACETLIAKNLIVVAGEITSNACPDYESIARATLRSIGYTDRSAGFDPDNHKIILSLSKQAGDIAIGVDRNGSETGAGDQGLMFGYAVNETEELMPLPISLAHKLVMKQAELRKSGAIPWLMPDCKSQVTVRYRNKKPHHVERVVLSTQHAENVSMEEVRAAVLERIIKKVIPEQLLSPDIQYFINPTGRFVEGGPQADTGLTGRKIIVDTYGGSCPHGGGAFSGKDPTKVDRSAAYAARYIAKNIVAAGIAQRCTIQLSYAIGIAEPLSILLDFHGTGEVDEEKVLSLIPDIFSLKPKGIIDMLDLRRPVYRKTAAYGHFGRPLPEFTWEKTDKAGMLKAYLS